ncbi:hypothetical protein GHT07_09310 [Caenimonas koreensis DSM 17982]|uniref:Uncharacterized protein n=1 Tax=Caenimonas koreensis DSM 17982 TaxID=1121255 RepID=A0A844ATP0_9BURK|nr:hypothetical protein [Caenimonas koreensis]MRD47474.1 hypothetical protein [Caenimonas koreensis DSM 17982]
MNSNTVPSPRGALAAAYPNDQAESGAVHQATTPSQGPLEIPPRAPGQPGDVMPLQQASGELTASDYAAVKDGVARRAVSVNDPKANKRVHEAIEAMYELARASKSLCRFDDALRWLDKCVDLYSLIGDVVGCALVDETMRSVTEMGVEIFTAQAVADRFGSGDLTIDCELYLRSTLWDAYRGIECPIDIRQINYLGRRYTVTFPFESLPDVSAQMARKFLADARFARQLPEGEPRNRVVAALEAVVGQANDRESARVLMNGLLGPDGGPLIPPAHQPLLGTEQQATYDASGNLLERRVPTPQVVADLIAGYLVGD